MAQARARRVRDIDGTTLPSLRGQPTDTRALADPTLELTRGGVLVFGEGVRSDLQRVGYRLEDNVLLRLTWPVLDRAPQTKPFESPLLRDVEIFEVRFYSLRGNSRVGYGTSAGPTRAGHRWNNSAIATRPTD